MSSSGKPVGLLGGTFDPVHNGHISIARSYLASPYIEKLYVTLTPSPPHKENRELTPYRHRKKMLEMAFRDIENSIISDVEKKLPEPSYTVNTVNYFKKKYPQSQLFLCIGEDSLADFKTWYQWKQILAKSKLLVARRPDTHFHDLDPEIAGQACFVDHEPVDISSSDLRKRMTEGKPVGGMLPDDVIDYIQEHDLYQK